MHDAHQPLDILHITAGSDAGGLSRYVLDVSGALLRDGHKVTVAGDVGVWQNRFDATGVNYLHIPLKQGATGVWRSIRALKQWIRQHGSPDVIHTHYRRATWVARRLRSVTPAPVLYTLHLSHMNVTGLRRVLSDFGDTCHCASADARNWALTEKLVTDNNAIIIPHGIALNDFSPATETTRDDARSAMNIPPHVRVAAYVGRLDTPKNVEWLLDIARLWNDPRPVLLLIAGDGPDRAMLENLIRQHHLHARVQLLGEIDPRRVYHAADVLLLASSREGFSYVCCEAMACGLPVIRTRTSGCTEIILDNITGHATPIDRNAFVTCAINTLADEDACRHMGQQASIIARQRFDIAQQMNQTFLLYQNLCTGKSK
jgi:glycosyltransferase involved in cell wall biosynthesis